MIEVISKTKELHGKDPTVIQFIPWYQIGDHRFSGCEASEDDDCSDNDGVACEDCPHWHSMYCKKCGNSTFEWIAPAKNDGWKGKNPFDQKSWFRCKKCGEKIRAWNF